MKPISDGVRLLVLTLAGLHALAIPASASQEVCPDTIVIAGCDTGVPALLPDGTCLQGRVDSCLETACNQADFVACVASLRDVADLPHPFLGQIFACAGAVQQFLQQQECPGVFRWKGKSNLVPKVQTCADDEFTARAGCRQKENVERAAKVAAEARCKESLPGCTDQKCGPRDSKTCQTTLVKFDVADVTRVLPPANTAKRDTCPEGETVWECDIWVDWSFECRCRCPS